MKISGSTSAGSLAGSRGGARGAQAGFAPSGGAAAQAASPSAHAASIAALGSLDALLALQETGGPTERRRRAVRRAGRLLDVLEDLKIALLDDGAPPPGSLELLRATMREARQATDDVRLDGVLDEIETRAAVELAKQEVAQAV